MTSQAMKVWDRLAGAGGIPVPIETLITAATAPAPSPKQAVINAVCLLRKTMVPNGMRIRTIPRAAGGVRTTHYVLEPIPDHQLEEPTDGQATPQPV